ncbi:MAG: hypothetical protein A3D28_04400 [Omnitrophica bacterium RIFCSPHIGHO2_02_FULL_63_14]|nr:MAG: hypothetical protein A3D28_04400 [Omnitrophica bacterium RIFCSPHIGHO2_02_FULL_63_14]
MCFLAALTLLLARLAYLQLFQSSKFVSLVQNQSRAIIDMQPARGRILDRRNRELASDVRLNSLYAIAREIPARRKPELATRLAGILGSSRGEILRRLQKDKMKIWLKRKITAPQAEQVTRLGLRQLGFEKESLRVYPKGQTACHLLGFTDIDNNGLEGIELRYNSFLKGVPGWRLAQRDAHQRELVSKELRMVPPVDGYSIRLTIDEVIQAIAEKELNEACRKYRAAGGSVIVLDPATGDVLAMAVYPAYDPNDAKRSSPEARRNRAITDLFEPGSVFKMITLAGIIENKTFPLSEMFHCENGSWAVAGKVLHDHRGHGRMPFREVIEKSSNIGTVKGAMRLGADKLYHTIRSFGFGQATGIGLAGEIGGIVPHPKHWSRSSIINIPIGHGIAVTPLQLAAAFGAVANDGVLMRPRILIAVEDNEGKTIRSYPPEAVRQAVSKETALQVRTVLEGVVSRGTGKKAQVPGFKAAGKTGTAQKILPDGKYSHSDFIASFVGFVPYDRPKLVIAVSVDEPRPVYYGGEVAAPVFSRVAAGVLAYWRINETRIPAEVLPRAA